MYSSMQMYSKVLAATFERVTKIEIQLSWTPARHVCRLAPIVFQWEQCYAIIVISILA